LLALRDPLRSGRQFHFNGNACYVQAAFRISASLPKCMIGAALALVEYAVIAAAGLYLPGANSTQLS
jgi:hypothetical protein